MTASPPVRQEVDPPFSLKEALKETPLGKHPLALPMNLDPDLPAFLCDVPSPRSETWRWEKWLENCRARQARHPDSLYAKEMVRVAEAALAYRATIPPDQVFWRR